MQHVETKFLRSRARVPASRVLRLQDVNIGESMCNFLFNKFPDIKQFVLYAEVKESCSSLSRVTRLPPIEETSPVPTSPLMERGGPSALLVHTASSLGTPCPLLISFPLRGSERNLTSPQVQGVRHAPMSPGRLSPKPHGGGRIRRVNLQPPRRWDHPIIPQVKAFSIPLQGPKGVPSPPGHGGSH